jgi:hypothetical protein
MGLSGWRHKKTPPRNEMHDGVEVPVGTGGCSGTAVRQHHPNAGLAFEAKCRVVRASSPDRLDAGRKDTASRLRVRPGVWGWALTPGLGIGCCNRLGVRLCPTPSAISAGETVADTASPGRPTTKKACPPASTYGSGPHRAIGKEVHTSRLLYWFRRPVVVHCCSLSACGVAPQEPWLFHGEARAPFTDIKGHA